MGPLIFICGYAAVFDVISGPLPDADDREQIRPGALTLGTLGYPAVIATIGHDPGRRLGGTADGSLRLAIDRIGLHVTLDPSGSTWGADAVQLVREGAIRGMSFSFINAVRSGPRLERGLWIRDLISCHVVEVCLAYRPIYPQTVLTLREAPRPARTSRPGADRWERLRRAEATL